MHTYHFSRFYHLVSSYRRISKCDVVKNASRKKKYVLQYDSYLASERFQFIVFYFHIIYPDFSFLNVVKTIEEADNGSFTASGMAHQGYRLSRFCNKGNIF